MIDSQNFESELKFLHGILILNTRIGGKMSVCILAYGPLARAMLLALLLRAFKWMRIERNILNMRERRFNVPRYASVSAYTNTATATATATQTATAADI